MLLPINQWLKTGEGKYQFRTEANGSTSLAIHQSDVNSKATVIINGENFAIQRTGFWKTKLEILDSNGKIIIAIAPEKWYSDSFKMEWNDTIYKLKVRNNPLAEWVIQQDDTDILAYGLQAVNGMTSTRITEQKANTPLLLHTILWYLFVPIATENQGDNLSFLLLLSA